MRDAGAGGAVTERQRCRYEITGPKDRYTGKVWWRRFCKRIAVPGTDRCWQHARPEVRP